MSILIDPPLDWGGKFKRCSHMFSDLDGDAGRDELMAFALRIGMRADWLQKASTWGEHFDVLGSRRDRAVLAGAREVTHREAVNVWRRKRGDPPVGLVDGAAGAKGGREP